MKEKQKKFGSSKKKFILRHFIPFCILAVLAIFIMLAVGYEINHLGRVREQIDYAARLSETIEAEIDSREEEKAEIERQFVIQSDLKTNLIFCFTDFENSYYKKIIESMEEYGYPGVIVFRSDNMPGMTGSITVEQYQELLTKGWEGAVSTEKGKMLYEYMADPVIDKWKNYMDGMRTYFQSNGLEFPSVYIKQQDELLTSVERYFPEYGITAYATVEKNILNAATSMSNDSVWNMGMIKAKYTYTDLQDDLMRLQYQGKSVALRFLTVESSAPKNKNNTSVYRLNSYLKSIEENGNVMVNTFSGYKRYQNEFEEENAELVNQYRSDLKRINEEIKSLEEEDEENYRKAVSCCLE